MRKIRIDATSLLGWLFLFITTPLFAQVRHVGKIVAYKKVPGGIEGRTTSAIFDIRAYDDRVVRVRISTKKAFTNFSYALVGGQPSSFALSVQDSGRYILLRTLALTVLVEKEPELRVRFATRNGEVINEDADPDGTIFSDGRVNLYKKLQEGERFVGLGEALGNLDRRGTGVTLANTDTYKYGDPRLPMYVSIPFYIGIHHRLQYGIFCHNTYRTFFNFGLSVPFLSVTADGGDADYFLLYDSSVAGILERYASLTGKMPLPPKWSLGYQQSRCTYYPQSKVEWIAESFRKKQIPIDGLVLDADYQQDYQPFRTNKERFPDLPALSAKLRGMNIRLTASVYPGVKIDSTYASYSDGLKKDVFVKYDDGRLFRTEIPPLPVYLPDYTNPKTRAWWAEKMKWMKDNGISGYWNDMNEPATGGSYLPDNLQFDFDGRKAGTAEAKNVYGFQMARSSYEAALAHNGGERPFILTRSAFAGIQRYSAVWSGDNTASDEGLLSGVLLNSQLGLSGVPFTGPDLGGYIGDGSKDLFRRWIEAGVFSPYVRNHKEFFVLANEPWSYGEEVEMISKSYIGFRYRLMPYIYSKFYEASQTGMPVVRSLCIDDPYDDKVYDRLYQYEFLFGDALLVVPVTTQESLKKIYLPAGDWYDLFTDEPLPGGKEFSKPVPGHRIPVYVKASAIIPMQTTVQSTGEKQPDTLFVHVYNGARKNEFVYYEDDGESFSYRQGVFCKRTIGFDPEQKQIRFSAQTGTYRPACKNIRLFLHGFGAGYENATINGISRPLQPCSAKLLDGLEYLEDYYDRNYYKALREEEPSGTQKSLTIDDGPDEIVIQL